MRFTSAGILPSVCFVFAFHVFRELPCCFEIYFAVFGSGFAPLSLRYFAFSCSWLAPFVVVTCTVTTYKPETVWIVYLRLSFRPLHLLRRLLSFIWRPFQFLTVSRRSPCAFRLSFSPEAEVYIVALGGNY